MADESNGLEDLLRRLIRDELQREGGLERLLDANKFLQGSMPMNLHVEPRLSFDVGWPDPVIKAEGILSGEAVGEPAAVVAPPMTATASMTVPEVVIGAIESASPELAKEIRARDPREALQAVTLFTAYINLLTALVTVYLAVHPASSVSPAHITQLFGQSTHVTISQTTIISPLPAPGPRPQQP